MGWYEERFEPKAGRIECRCLHCARPYWLPPSQAPKRTTCGVECRAQLNAEIKAARKCACEACGKEFVPRATQLAVGRGRFCSSRCSTKQLGQLWTPEARKKAAASFFVAIEDGRYVPPKGERHHQWTGGTKATTQRRIQSGKSREQLRRYRAARPDVQREAAHRRKAAKVGRLPKGTVKRIGAAQRWKCVACCCDLKRAGYHMDHIMPLSKGGRHAPENIQLLCPSCNVRKSAKDPIAFMQERGFLL